MKIRKAGNDKFVEGVCNMIAELGAKKVKDSNSTFRSFELETIVGKLEIKVETDNVHCFSVFTRFENVEKAKVKFPCNPHSGKYNIHISPIPYKHAIGVVKAALEGTLPKKDVSL